MIRFEFFFGKKKKFNSKKVKKNDLICNFLKHIQVAKFDFDPKKGLKTKFFHNEKLARFFLKKKRQNYISLQKKPLANAHVLQDLIKAELSDFDRILPQPHLYCMYLLVSKRSTKQV